MGRFVKFDEENFLGPWRMYMRIRVAVNIHEPLKRNMVFEKEDGAVVNVSFKYEKVGVFCYICGLLGHTDNVCPKRVEPGFVDGPKGWGKFLNAGGRTIGGGITVNKWSRGGRMLGRGGGDGGRRGAVNTNGAGANVDNNMNVVVMEQSSEHCLFGRVRVLRGGGFNFQRLVTSVIGHTGGGEGQWVPFVLNDTNIENQRTIRRLVNGLDAGIGGTRNDNTSDAGDNTVNSISAGEQTNALMLGDACKGMTSSNGMLRLTGCNQVLGMPIVNSGGPKQVNKVVIGETSERGRVVCAKKKVKPIPSRPIIAGPLLIREGALAVNNIPMMEVPQGDKGKGKMEDEPSIKKRTRPNMSTEDIGNPGSAVEQENPQMLVDTDCEGADAGGNFVSVQNNPLFSDNIVMAEAENQPRQQP